MPGYGTAFGRGFLLGAGAALLYAAARETVAPNRSKSPESMDQRRLIDWDWATNVAIRTAGRVPALHPAPRARSQREYEDLLRKIEEPISPYPGNRLGLSNTSVEVLD